jgi:hypothetical protein
MALDRTIQVLQVLVPIAGTIPLAGQNLKAALEATEKLCEVAKVGHHDCHLAARDSHQILFLSSPFTKAENKLKN